MNVNRVLFFKSNEAKKQYFLNKPGDFTTKFIYLILRIMSNILLHWIISQCQQVGIM